MHIYTHICLFMLPNTECTEWDTDAWDHAQVKACLGNNISRHACIQHVHVCARMLILKVISTGDVLPVCGVHYIHKFDLNSNSDNAADIYGWINSLFSQSNSNLSQLFLSSCTENMADGESVTLPCEVARAAVWKDAFGWKHVWVFILPVWELLCDRAKWQL